MAINIIQGYNPSTTEPIDSRQTIADQTSRYAIPSYNAYNGMIVYQQDTKVLWVLIDIANIDNSSGWQQVGAGGGDTSFSSANISSATSVNLFSVDPVNASVIIDYNLEFNNGSNYLYLSRTGEIVLHIPRDYTNAYYEGTTIIQSVERVVENYVSIVYKSDPSNNSGNAVFSFYYNTSTQLVDIIMNNLDRNKTLTVKGKYKTIAR
jgi:hypothetical protein